MTDKQETAIWQILNEWLPVDCPQREMRIIHMFDDICEVLEPASDGLPGFGD